MDVKGQVQDQFGAVARNYVTSAVHVRGADLDRIGEEAAQLRPNLALDVGTAAGHVALVLAPHSRTVVGLDLTAPMLEQAQRVLMRHNGTVLGVTYLDNSSDSEQFVRREHITYPVIRDVSGSFVRSLGTTGVPETFVIDRQGRIAAVRRYQLSSTWLDQKLPALGFTLAMRAQGQPTQALVLTQEGIDQLCQLINTEDDLQIGQFARLVSTASGTIPQPRVATLR